MSAPRTCCLGLIVPASVGQTTRVDSACRSKPAPNTRLKLPATYDGTNSFSARRSVGAPR